jgi:N-acetylmuramoyl-L-alanine amidase
MIWRPFVALFYLALIASAQALTFNTVVIDPGHGGRDGGCVWNGLIEKKLCLDTALRLEKILKARGLRVIMTRRTDVDVDLDRRAAIANKASKSVFVSIHFNASRNRSISGMEVFYRSSRGKVLASKILRWMDVELRGINRGIYHSDFKVLRGTLMPAALIECGYLSNLAEARRCATAAHRQDVAEAIAKGIIASRS